MWSLGPGCTLTTHEVPLAAAWHVRLGARVERGQGCRPNSISRFEFVCAFECLCFSVVFHVRDSVETVAAAPIA